MCIYCTNKLIFVLCRNGASPGLWLCFMLPSAVVLGFWNHPNCSYSYRTSTCLSIGLLLSSLTVVFQVNHSAQFRTVCCAINSITTTLLLYYFSHHSKRLLYLQYLLFYTSSYFKIIVFGTEQRGKMELKQFFIMFMWKTFDTVTLNRLNSLL